MPATRLEWPLEPMLVTVEDLSTQVRSFPSQHALSGSDNCDGRWIKEVLERPGCRTGHMREAKPLYRSLKYRKASVADNRRNFGRESTVGPVVIRDYAVLRLRHGFNDE